MTPEQKNLYNEIDEILWNDWDPIGVNDTEEARSEYQSYTPAIYVLKTTGADKTAIAAKLHDIETVTMGLGGDNEHCRQIAQKIVDLKF